MSYGGTRNPPHIPKGCVLETLHLTLRALYFYPDPMPFPDVTIQIFSDFYVNSGCFDLSNSYALNEDVAWHVQFRPGPEGVTGLAKGLRDHRGRIIKALTQGNAGGK